MKLKLFKKILTVLIIVLGSISVFCFLFPAVSNIINDYFNESTINEYNSNVDSTSREDIQTMFSKAERYNEIIATDYFTNQNKNAEYERILNSYSEILNVNDGLIGYIEIPSIGVRLPIYHTEKNSDEVFKKGAVHMEYTSFPVEGNDIHACVSAHSGFPTQKFFDDIDELEPDDVIYIKILNQTIEYRVSGREVVEPDDITRLKTEKGKNILSLITCYPYGINSHRLIINADFVEMKTGKRASADEIQLNEESDTEESPYIAITCAVGVSAAILAIVWLVILKRKRRLKSAVKREKGE